MAKRRSSSYADDIKGAGEFEATFDAIYKGPQIGEGAFSKIYLGRYFGEIVAVKEQVRDSEEMDEYLKREISILKEVSHPNVLNFCGSTERVADDGTYCLYILTEYAQAGDMSQLMFGNAPLGWRFRCQLLREAAKGIEYLHNRNLVHRDIKGENFLLTKDWQVKVSDLGMARPLIESSSTTMTICGTTEYMAPELMFDEAYHNPVDVYAFGMVIFETMKRQKVGSAGFMDRSPADNFAFDEDAARSSLPDDAPVSLVELAIQSLSYNDYDRPCSEDVAGWLEDLMSELPEDAESIPAVQDMPNIPSPPSPPPFNSPAMDTPQPDTRSRSLSEPGDVAGASARAESMHERQSSVIIREEDTDRGSVLDQECEEETDTVEELPSHEGHGPPPIRGRAGSSQLLFESNPMAARTKSPLPERSRRTTITPRASKISSMMSGIRDTFSPNRRATVMLKSPVSPGSDDDGFSGELYKRGIGFNLLAWRRRFFLLRSGTLYWFASELEYEKTNEAMGKVDLSPETTIKHLGSQRFSITNPNCADARETQREFAAIDAEHYDLWVTHLRHSIDILRSGGSSPKRKGGDIRLRAEVISSAAKELTSASEVSTFESVEDWLSSLGLKEELQEKFEAAGYKSMTAINEMGLMGEDLDAIGVDRPQARRMLSMASKGGFAPQLRLRVNVHRELGDVVVYEVLGAHRFMRSSAYLSYADFVKLHAKLKYNAKRQSMRQSTSGKTQVTSPSLPNLPSDHITIHKNMRSEAFLHRRRAELNSYLQRISELAQEEAASQSQSSNMSSFLIDYFRLDTRLR